METLLSREQFSSEVFKRDKNTCIFCEKPAIDAHHILDRKLWNNGGYYLSNGASVCASHHWDCEKTLISVEDVRKACGIQEFILPENFSFNLSYDKWGNIIKEDGYRIKGPLFEDDGVQKILKQSGLLYLFY